MSKPLKVAVTGGMGSGKTTVVNFFKELDIPIYVADDKAKMLMQQNIDLIKAIKKYFGQESYHDDGSLNKTFLAEQVFEDSKKLEVLNNLVHPAVRKDFDSWHKSQNSPYVIYESALIFEHNQQRFFDLIILVTAPQKLRINRIKKRNNWTEYDIQKRMNKQMDDNLKKDYVNYVIENINIKLTKLEVLKINNNILDIFYFIY